IGPSKDSDGKFKDAICFKNGEMESVGYGQGTGFYLKNIGLITNFHVIEDIIFMLEDTWEFNKEYYIEYFCSSSFANSSFAKVLAYDRDEDIAILKPEYLDAEGYEYNINIED